MSVQIPHTSSPSTIPLVDNFYMIKSVLSAAVVVGMSLSGCARLEAVEGAKKFEKSMRELKGYLPKDPKKIEGDKKCQPRSVIDEKGDMFSPDRESVLYLNTDPRYRRTNYVTYESAGTSRRRLFVYSGNEMDGVLRIRSFVEAAGNSLSDIMRSIGSWEPGYSSRPSKECKLRCLTLPDTPDPPLMAKIVGASPHSSGFENVPCSDFARMPAVAIKMLQRIHALGLVHGGVTSSSFGLQNVGGSIVLKYIGDFTKSRPWVNIATGMSYVESERAHEEADTARLVPDREVSLPQNSRANDLASLAGVLLKALKTPSECGAGMEDTLNAFAEAVVVPTDRPAYEHWITQFEVLAATITA